ncbi:hypothetical protein XELAEV_18012782mg [Xenopus laevis]|uniref:Uncharacterized protein n=1 Tax=Xenopus laevis TaxID=8355 RepID=A0A974DN84_XENLA|nr:hypothetical protein XELAEV_18012782mg [Xenopus laevis]
MHIKMVILSPSYFENKIQNSCLFIALGNKTIKALKTALLCPCQEGLIALQVTSLLALCCLQNDSSCS